MTKPQINFYGLFSLMLAMLLVACGDEGGTGADAEAEPGVAADYPRGPHGARILRDGDFAVELAIFETGVPPEFHAWGYFQDAPVDPSAFELQVTLTRLDTVDVMDFRPQEDFLRSNGVVHEPHSFVVTVDARFRGASRRWEYDSLEGRTTISPALVTDLGIETAIAGPAEIRQELQVFGRIQPNPDYSRSLYARFDGPIREVNVTLGQDVRAGQTLLVVESNESLKPYAIEAPISGRITRRNANPGEQTNGRLLLEITDTSKVWAELALFPADREKVRLGAAVSLVPGNGGEVIHGSISQFATELGAGQTLIARVPVENLDGRFAPGTFVRGTINTGNISVPLAVRREGLQSFRDFTVVYAKVGNQYEVRMLDLGRQDSELVEVLGGLNPGTEYVTTNSYIIKADVEKSGASHDH